MTIKPDFKDRKGWRIFPSVIKMLGIPEKGIFHYLKKGLQPFQDIVPRRLLSCPERHHEFNIKTTKKREFELILEVLPEFVSILEQVHSNKIVNYKNSRELFKIWDMLLHKIPINERKPYPINRQGTISCSLKNTSWIIPEMIENLEKGLKAEIQVISDRLKKINKVDPNHINWKYAVGPYEGDELDLYGIVFFDSPPKKILDGLKDLWTDEDIQQTLSDLRKCFFRIEHVKRFITPKKKVKKKPWYSWDENSRILTLLETQEQLQFKNMGAKVINLFDQANRKKPPGQEYAVLSLETIRNTFAERDPEGNKIEPGYKRDMGSFFQMQPWWKKVLHTTPAVQVLRDIYKFSPPQK